MQDIVYEGNTNVVVLKRQPRTEENNPRKAFYLGNILTWSAYVPSPDPHNYSDPHSFLVTELAQKTDYHPEALNRKTLKQLETIWSRVVLYKPIYIHFVNGRILVKTNYFPEYTKIGYIYVDREVLKLHWNIRRFSPQVLAKLSALMDTTIDNYFSWLNNDIFTYACYAKVPTLTGITAIPQDHSEGVVFYGTDWTKNQLIHHLKYVYRQLVLTGGDYDLG